jgi:GNAT superfamily N-acetyltransferase
VEINEVTRQSPWQHIADLTSLLLEQMKAIGSPKADKDVKLAVENALKPGSSARFFVCYDDDQAVGCCLLNIGSGIEASGDYIWINEIHVRKNRRRQGIGKTLLKHVLKWANVKGYKYIASVTFPSNRAAKELFTQQGFDESDMVWLVKQD